MRGITRMRFFTLAFAFAATACAALPYHAPARPIVVLVHGRGQLDADTALLRRDWKRDLDSSLTMAGLPAGTLGNSDVRLAWYADILDPRDENGCTQAQPSGDSTDFGDFARGFLSLIAGGIPRDESREVRGLMGDLMYALDGSKRCAAERRVGGVIDAALRENRPVIVVAYSLGSLVTYGWLRQQEAVPGRSLRLITVGSPLGVQVIRELVFGDGSASNALRMPALVSSWENVYDPNDFLSAPLSGLLRSGSVRDRATHASERDVPHNLDRYLRDTATGTALMRAICDATNRQTSGCAASRNEQ